MPSAQKPRPEAEIFEDLARLCIEPGFAHAVAFLCFRDNTIRMASSLTAQDVLASYSPQRLIRTEMSTLIGLMLKSPLDLRLPQPMVLQSLIDRAEALLQELHAALGMLAFSEFTPDDIAAGHNPFADASVLREPIFYGGESAYDFQYRDFAPTKYRNDADWLLANKGFTIEQASSVFRALEQVQSDKVNSHLQSLRQLQRDEWAMLPAFTYSLEEISKRCSLEDRQVRTVLEAFTLPAGSRNETFNALNDFNTANAYPILRASDDNLIVFQMYSLFEAFYETPFFWMNEDQSYRDTALRHRGSFTESFCYDRLCRVFGKKRVFANVKIRDHRDRDVGEIDILVKFSHIGIVVQAKSKRLTLEARKGNDGVLKSDFQKSIQSSYDQGLSCAQELIKRRHRWFDRAGNEIKFDTKFERILILCVVADHYPALAFQCRQLLKPIATETIPAPFVMDVFTLDIIAEMLDTPLYFLDYVTKRTKYFDKISISHELTALSYHLKRNLWLEDRYDFVHFADDITTDLDVAVVVRRRGVPGRATPDGLLTRFADKAIGRFLRQIETLEHRATTDLGFLLLSLSEETLDDLSAAMEELALRARQDAKGRDVTLWFKNPSTGLTIHVNDDEPHRAQARLFSHCEIRKYKQRATQWFGVCLSPVDLAPRFGLEINYPWVHDEERERRYGAFQGAQPPRSLRAALRKSRRKIGRNEPCPCGSGLKYKRCCLNKS